MIELYKPNLDDKIINAQYGDIPYLEWLMKEKERIEKDPKRKAEIFFKKNKSSLFVNEVEYCTCQKCLRKRKK